MEQKKIALITPTFPPKSGGISTAHYHLWKLLKDSFGVTVFAYAEERDGLAEGVVCLSSPRWFRKISDIFISRYFHKQSRRGPLTATRTILGHWPAIQKLNRHLAKLGPEWIIVPDHFLPARFLKIPGNSRMAWIAHHNYRRFFGHPLLADNDFNDNEIVTSMERRAVQKADLVICPSHYMARITEETLQPKVPVKVIYNTLDASTVARIRPLQLHVRSGIDHSVPFVYIPSSGTAIKGKRYVFELVRRLAVRLQNRVAFYLSGPISDDLVYELTTLKEVVVKAPGQIPWEENIAMVKSCSLVVSPALFENFSMALSEAAMCGLPIITFDVGGNREMVIDNKTGYLIEPQDVESMIQKAHLLLSNKVLRNRFGRESKKHIQKIIDPKTLEKQYKSFLIDENELQTHPFQGRLRSGPDQARRTLQGGRRLGRGHRSRRPFQTNRTL